MARPAERTTHRVDTVRLLTAIDGARRVLGISWEDVARQVGIGRATLYHIRDSGRCPQGDTLVSLLMWLGITDVSRFVVKRDRKGHDGE